MKYPDGEERPKTFRITGSPEEKQRKLKEAIEWGEKHPLPDDVVERHRNKQLKENLRRLDGDGNTVRANILSWLPDADEWIDEALDKAVKEYEAEKESLAG